MNTDLVGEMVGDRYELLDVIGRGGQGMVFRARDATTGADVAVKLIEGKAARDPQMIERMAREQQALIALAGTHAVGFLDMCSSSKGALCLVMELLRGQEFERYLVDIENGGSRISVAKLIEILGPIAETLEKAHSVGIIHRDLKPGNIFLLSPEVGGGSRLLDFGFARLSDSRRVTNTGMVMGSPSYIAPEMWKGQGRNTDHRVDVYAFGVIVYRALAGELPFPNASMQQTLMAVTTSPRPSLKRRRTELPVAVDAWVRRVLAVEPDERFPSVGACWDELLLALGADEAPARSRTGMTEPPPDFGKIRTWLQEPASQRAGQAQSVWAMAAQALKRLIGRSTPAARAGDPLGPSAPAAAPIVPMPTLRPARVPTTPPPLPPRQKAKASVPEPTRGAAKPLEPAFQAPLATASPGPEVGHQPQKSASQDGRARAEMTAVRSSVRGEAPVSIEDSTAREHPKAPRQGQGEKRTRRVQPPVPRARKQHVEGERIQTARVGPAKVAPPTKFDRPKWKSRRRRKPL